MALVLMALSSINISTFLNQKRVLGIATTKTHDQPDETQFWTDLLDKNPNYIPGWIEIGRIDQVKEIDPNYLIP